VRQLVFVRDARVEVSLGYHVAAFAVEGYCPRDELVYVSHAVPGRQVSRWSMREDRTLFHFAFRDEYLPADGPPTAGSGSGRRERSILSGRVTPPDTHVPLGKLRVFATGVVLEFAVRVAAEAFVVVQLVKIGE